MKKLLLVLGCAVLLAGCAQKPAAEETTEVPAETTGAMVEETATETTTTETTTETAPEAMTDTTGAAATGTN